MEEQFIEDFFGDIWFGDELANDADWRSAPDEEDPDDEELAVTPADVIGILGFDPKIFSEEKQVKGLSGLLLKGGPGSGNYNGPGSPRFATEGENDKLEQESRNSIYEISKDREDKQEFASIIINGKKIEIAGQESAVVFTQEQIDSMEFIVHNHPGGASFSGQDVAMFLLAPKLKKMEVVSPDGTLYSLEKLGSAMKLNSNIPDLNKLAASSAIYDWNSIMESMKPEFMQRFKSGEDSNTLWKEHSHLVMKQLALEKNLLYKRTLNVYKGFEEISIKMVSKDQQEGEFILDDSSIAEPPYGKKGK